MLAPQLSGPQEVRHHVLALKALSPVPILCTCSGGRCRIHGILSDSWPLVAAGPSATVLNRASVSPSPEVEMKRFAIPLLLGILAGSLSACAPATPPTESHPQAEFITSQVTQGLDLPFSEAVRIGDLVILSGMVGIRPGTMELAPGGLEAEARQALENIRTVLAASGASPRDVVKCTVMLDDIGEWGVFNQVYSEFFGDHRPTRSAFGADGLAVGAAVELECMALAPAGAAPGQG